MKLIVVSCFLTVTIHFSRGSTPDCNPVCTQEYKPVCGEAKKTGLQKTFANKCEFENEQCQNVELEWTLVDEDAGCDVERPCPRPCPRILMPVCAFSKRGVKQTFNNRCEFENKRCMEPVIGWTILNDNGPCPPRCPKPCTREYNPVCGEAKTTGLKRTFSNKCVFENEQCEHVAMNWVLIKEDGSCEGKQPCPRPCPKIMMPVCAETKDKEKHTFNNLCEFENKQCMEPVLEWTLVNDQEGCKEIL